MPSFAPPNSPQYQTADQGNQQIQQDAQQQAQQQPQAQPTAGGGFDNTPINATPGATLASPSPNASPSPSPNAQGTPASAGAPPAAFIAAVVAKLQQMIGTRYYLVSQSELQDIAIKMWNSVGMEQAWANYQVLGANYLVAFQAQIQNLILNPSSDPSLDPSITIDYVNAKQSAGESLTTAELNALSNASTASNSTIPKPFDTDVVSGYDWMQPLPSALAQYTGWANHLGVDYGTPEGSRIVTPFAGTVTVTHDKYYGNLVTITLDNGWKISFGHVGSIPVQNGARVNPGDLIAISGANVGDAKGAVTIVTWQDPSGAYHNPHSVLDPIFQGTTFADAGIPGAAGTGGPTVNTALDREYPSITADFKQYFGTPPSPEDVMNVLSHGNTPQQWTDYIRSLTSHIAGLNMGQAYDMRQAADSVSMSSLGHQSTDKIVQDLFTAGITTQKGIQFWYDEHSSNDLDSSTYNDIYKANKPYMGNILNDPAGFDPRIAKQQAALAKAHEKSGAAGGGGYT